MVGIAAAIVETAKVAVSEKVVEGVTEVVKTMAKEVGTDSLRELPKEIINDSLNSLPKEVINSSLENLTGDEINNLQIQVIKNAFERIFKGDGLSKTEKGNLGEILMDQLYSQLGYKPIYRPRMIDLENKAPKGIDGVFEKINKDGSKLYKIVEAKVNESQLNKNLADGTNQMDDIWVNKRLDDAVGKEKADEIREAWENNPDSVSKEVYRFEYGGEGEYSYRTSTIFEVDSLGNYSDFGKRAQTFDKFGNGLIEERLKNDQR